MTAPAQGMRSHRKPVLFQSPVLIATWDKCQDARYSVPCPARELTAAELAEEAREDELLRLAKVLKRR